MEYVVGGIRISSRAEAIRAAIIDWATAHGRIAMRPDTWDAEEIVDALPGWITVLPAPGEEAAAEEEQAAIDRDIVHVALSLMHIARGARGDWTRS